MAIYTGFFDAAFDEDTGTYDREYGSADFTEYFGQIVGSGVCVYGNDDSMKVYYDSASQRAVVNPGYLFIRGYWLRNDGLYTVNLADLPAGVYAIRAMLNMGSRAITIGQVAKADPEEYPDALVLAYATVEAGGGVSVEDTRGRTDICGLIDAAGSLSQKVEYAIYYIDNEIQAKLDQIQQDLQAQETEIDGKIEEANSLIAQIAPPAIGTIKFSASQNIEEGWLRCDGSFINEADYPELVAALGKNYPSGDKFQLLNTEGVGRDITNGVLLDGFLWTFSMSSKKLFLIPIDGGEVKSLDCTCDQEAWSSIMVSTLDSPLCLSIVKNAGEFKYYIFLSKILKNGLRFQGYPGYTMEDYSYQKGVVIMEARTNDLASSLNFQPPFPRVEDGTAVSINSNTYYQYSRTYQTFFPYVAIQNLEGGNRFVCLCGEQTTSYGTRPEYSNASALSWEVDGTHDSPAEVVLNEYLSWGSDYSRSGFNRKNNNEAVRAYASRSDSGIISYPQNIYSSEEGKGLSTISQRNSLGPICIVGADKVFSSFDLEKGFWVSSVGKNSGNVDGYFPPLPSSARIFPDAGAYAWGKDMYFIFVGTGIVFSRTLMENSFGYLDTTEILGIITQFGYMDYDEPSGTLYLLGQDTTNSIKAAKIVLNTLYDYANDGAWLPMIASDGIPAYIKAKEVGGA